MDRHCGKSLKFDFMSNSSTESDSNYNGLEQMSVDELLSGINQEDQTVAHSVQKVIPKISDLVTCLVARLKNGGRLFYVGAGTSGRLGVVDASECPPTFGVSHDLVVGLIAGGDSAIRKAVEFAEDDYEMGWADLQAYKINEKDFVVGIAASGRTPYVVGALDHAQKAGISTGCIACNSNTEVAKFSDYPVECVVGPEFVTGSTRMKSGTAQKLILNMISTAAMIQLGKVKGNKMVDMQLSNHKLVDRGTRMVMDATGLDESAAKALLIEKGSVRGAVEKFEKENR
jgi:N-acetylmuramic acid 6-phosphate etherase